MDDYTSRLECNIRPVISVTCSFLFQKELKISKTSKFKFSNVKPQM